MDARGSNNVISTSKIKKITAIRKNRNEKGNRADPLGSNPHSYGDLFSRSMIIFFDSNEARTIIIVANKIVIKIIDVIIIIAYSKIFRLVGWKPTILIILKRHKLSTSSIDKDIEK